MSIMMVLECDTNTSGEALRRVFSNCGVSDRAAIKIRRSGNPGTCAPGSVVDQGSKFGLKGNNHASGKSREIRHMVRCG